MPRHKQPRILRHAKGRHDHVLAFGQVVCGSGGVIVSLCRPCVLSAVRNPRDHMAHGHIGAFAGGDIRQKAVAMRLDFHRGLVGFDLEQHFALGDGIARLLVPRDDQPGFLRHAKRRHDHVKRH